MCEKGENKLFRAPTQYGKIEIKQFDKITQMKMLCKNTILT